LSFAGVTHQYLDNLPGDAPYDVHVTVTDKDGASTSSDAAETVRNVAPTVSFTSQSISVQGQTRTFDGTAVDPGTLDTLTATVDYGDGSGVQPVTVNSDRSIHFNHVYTSAGSFNATVTVTDKDGATGTYTLPVSVAVVAIEPDPADATKTQVAVGGTTGDDAITVTRALRQAGLAVTLNGVFLGVYTPTARVVIFGQAGNDIEMAAQTDLPTQLFGGDGNDILYGGDAGSMLVGGAGNDLLVGGNGRDILIGGLGADRLLGNAGDDILVAGSTSYDADPTALIALRSEWISSDAYADRVRLIQNGGGLNGAKVLNSSTVFNDSSADTLAGNDGQDWFLYNFTGDGTRDVALDAKSTEVQSDI
jgi:Ca2+-binding RTX toxin-like protein